MSSRPYPSTRSRAPSRARLQEDTMPQLDDESVAQAGNMEVSSSGPRRLSPLTTMRVVQPQPIYQTQPIPGPSQIPTHSFIPSHQRAKTSMETLEDSTIPRYPEHQQDPYTNTIIAEQQKQLEEQRAGMLQMQQQLAQVQLQLERSKNESRSSFRSMHSPTPQRRPPGGGNPGGGNGGPPGGGHGGPGGPYNPGHQVQPQIGIKIKAALPDMFDGSTSKLEDWFRQMETYFILQSSVFVNDEAKILTAFQFCRGGTAGEWAKYHTEQYLLYRQGQPCNWRDVVIQWDDLKSKMKERFGDQYEKETARAKVYRSKQGDRKIRQYIEEFIQNLVKADLPEDQQCQYLLGGVNDELWEIIRNTEGLMTKSFQRLCIMLETAEKNYVTRQIAADQRRRQQRKDGNTSQPQTSQKSYFQNTRREVTQTSRPGPSTYPTKFVPSAPQYPSRERELPQGDPMDVDRLRKKQASGSRVKCYKCRQLGHVWKQCPVKNVRELKEEQIQEILEEHFNNDREYDLSAPYGLSEGPKEAIEEEEEPEEDTRSDF